MRGRATAVHTAQKRKKEKNRDFEVSALRLDNVEDLVAVIALTEGRVHDIKYEDVELMFNRLSLDGGTLVKYIVLERLLVMCLQLSDVELDTIRQKVQVQLGGVISAQQFFSVLHKPVVIKLLEQAWRDRRVDDYQDKKDAKPIVERNFLQAKVAWRVDRDDAFGTLPMNTFYMIVFMLLVVYHLQIWRRQELERGIESWIENQGEFYYGPFISEHVYSRDTFRHWLKVSGLPGIFGNVKDHDGGTEVRMDNTNIVVGDVFLRQYYGEEYNEKIGWLLSNKSAIDYIDGRPGDPERYLGAARLSVEYLLDSSYGWVSDETRELSLFFHTYNNQAEMYAKTEIRVRLDRFGHVKPIIKARAVMCFAYPFPVVYLLDVLYCLIILRTLWTELKDMCAACVLGFGEFVDYWTFWNAVDWASMTLGFINIALWVVICLLMQADSLHSQLSSSAKVRLNVIDMSMSDMEQMHSDMERIYKVFVALHITVAATAIFIVLKFFKGFSANPRLQTVTATLSFVATDVSHFFIVFIAVFTSFAVIGHVLFGGDITKFYTLASSFNTGITVLMGEFDWYSDLSDKPDTLPSGMPRILLIIWFVAYMTFVLLIMLNMLLAMILERYSEVSELLSTRTDARTIWNQSIRWTQRKIEMRGFIPLYRIRRLLENDLDPAHPKKVVTEDSLIDSFPGMTTEQAHWIMNFLEAELVDELRSMQEDEEETRAKRTERFVQSITEELHVVGALVTDNRDRLRELENAFRTTGFSQIKARTGAQAALKEAASDGNGETEESKAKDIKAYREALQISGLDEPERSEVQNISRWMPLRCTQSDGQGSCCL